MRKYLTLGFICFILQTQALAAAVSNSFYPALFHNLIIKGNFNVKLYSGYKSPKVVISSCANDFNNIALLSKNDSLYIHNKITGPNHCESSLSIYTGALNKFTYEGSGYISGRISSSNLTLDINNNYKTKLSGSLGLVSLRAIGKGELEISGIKSSNLSLDIQNNAKVKLIGFANLANINLQHKAHLNMYWVNSRELRVVEKDAAYLWLAGVAHKLNAELWGHTQFDARYLRADLAFVKTHDKSLARISSLLSQHTLAMDQSDILFYNLPVFKTDFMAEQGSTLDFRALNAPKLGKYTPFNGQ